MKVVDVLGLVRSDYEIRRLRSADSAGASMGHVDDHLGHLKVGGTGPGYLLSQDLQRYVMDRRDEGAAEGTIRIELILCKKGFRLAAEEGRITLDSIPKFPKIDKRGLRVRKGFFTRPELQLLLKFLRDEDVRDLVEFLFESAWRVGEALVFEWSWVDQDAIRVPAAITKTNEPHVLALQGAIARIVERRRSRAIGPFVFHRAGQPIKNFRHAWITACLRAGLLDPETRKHRNVHDLRRSGVTEMVELGFDRKTIKSVSGHKTDSMLERYQMVSLTRQRQLLDARDGKQAPARGEKKNVVRLRDWGT